MDDEVSSSDNDGNEPISSKQQPIDLSIPSTSNHTQEISSKLSQNDQSPNQCSSNTERVEMKSSDLGESSKSTTDFTGKLIGKGTIGNETNENKCGNAQSLGKFTLDGQDVNFVTSCSGESVTYSVIANPSRKRKNINSSESSNDISENVETHETNQDQRVNETLNEASTSTIQPFLFKKYKNTRKCCLRSRDVDSDNEMIDEVAEPNVDVNNQPDQTNTSEPPGGASLWLLWTRTNADVNTPPTNENEDNSSRHSQDSDSSDSSSDDDDDSDQNLLNDIQLNDSYSSDYDTNDSTNVYFHARFESDVSIDDEPFMFNDSLPSLTQTEIETYEKICAPQLKPDWWALKEICSRQYGQRTALGVQFQQRYYKALHTVQRFELMAKLEFHDGCVNSLGFNKTGSLLASGSDDLRVVIWDWYTGQRKASWVTKHNSNVFQTKFLPLGGNSDIQIVSAARDGQVWLWQLADGGLRGSRKLGMHSAASHKVSIVPDQPQVVLSCGEDGVVLLHDVRDHKAKKILKVKNPERKSETVGLYSVHVNPLKTMEFCVAGCYSKVLAYDQRNLSAPMKMYFSSKEAEGEYPRQITCAMYNYCGSEIVASYADHNICLFDTNVDGDNCVSTYRGHRNARTLKNVNFFGPRSEYIVSGSDCKHMYIWEKNSQGIVQSLLADTSVVNSCEPHPSMPVIASSGLDKDVKIWMPSREQPNEMKGLQQRLEKNARRNHRIVESENGLTWEFWRTRRNNREPNVNDADSDISHNSNVSTSNEQNETESHSSDNESNGEQRRPNLTGCIQT